MRSVYMADIISLPLNVSEFENLLVGLSKGLENSSSSVRRSFANLFAIILCNSQKSPRIFKSTSASPPKNTENQTLFSYVLSVSDMLSLLPRMYFYEYQSFGSTPKPFTKEVKVAIIESYVFVFRNLGVGFIEENYSLITKILVEFCANPKLAQSSADAHLARECAAFLLREVIGKSLSETGQVLAIKELVSRLNVGDNSVVLEEASLVCILDEISALLYELGSAAFVVQDQLVDNLFRLSLHTSHSVRLAVAAALRSLCLALPNHLSKLVTKLAALIQKESGLLSPDRNESIDRLVGLGHILSALIRVIPLRPLFASYDEAAQIFSLSTQMLRASLSAKDFRVMTCQAQVAWALIGSLMSLGPHFVKVHISQLLLIWKNVLPKIQPKDSVGTRHESEWTYILVSRNAALAALHSFLVFNCKELVTLDVAKRIVVCLNNVLQFFSTLAGIYSGISEQHAPIPAQLRLYEHECLLKKRLFQCFVQLGVPQNYDSIFTVLMKFTIDTFAADPEKLERFPLLHKDGSAPIQAVMAASLVSGNEYFIAQTSGAEERNISNLISKDTDLQKLEDLIEGTPAKRIENDPYHLFLGFSNLLEYDTDPHLVVNRLKDMPVSGLIGVVDSAIELFATIFSVQTIHIQEILMEQLLKTSSFNSTRITPSMKKANQLNSLVAVVGVLKHEMGRRSQFSSGQIYITMRDIAKPFLKSPDLQLRSGACEIIGRLARVNGTASFVNPIIDMLVDQVVNNRDPDSRSGAALAMGSLMAYVGGMSSGSHLKTVVQVLHSLASDPHPMVHTWALQGLFLTIESAGLMFGPFVNMTLSLIVKLFMSEAHEISATQANLSGADSNSKVNPCFGRILYAIIGVIGPELQSSSRLRDICFNLYEQFKNNDEDPHVVIEAIKCIQNFILFAPRHVDIPMLIPFLQVQICGSASIIRKASVTCLYQLAQRDATSVLEAANNHQLEEQLFGLLDIETDPMIRAEIKDILSALLRHVAETKPSRWIDLSKSILAKNSGATKAKAVEISHDQGDDDVPKQLAETRIVDSPKAIELVVLLPRWRTQVFAIECVRMVIKVVTETNITQHTNLKGARLKRSLLGPENTDFLVFRVPDMIRLAFNSSTANVYDLRSKGLFLLRDLLETFLKVEDPDFEGHCLLEQYEAQIVSALAPAFGADSHPEITSTACKVCSYFIGSGISQDVFNLGRPLKLLSNLAEDFAVKTAGTRSSISSTASYKVKLAVLNAWTDIYASSKQIPDLAIVVDANLKYLTRLWISSLEEYSKLLVDSDPDTAGRSLKTNVYASAVSEITLPVLKRSNYSFTRKAGSLFYPQ